MGQCLSIPLRYPVLLWRVGRGVFDVDVGVDAQSLDLLSNVLAAFVVPDDLYTKSQRDGHGHVVLAQRLDCFGLVPEQVDLLHA